MPDALPLPPSASPASGTAAAAWWAEFHRFTIVHVAVLSLVAAAVGVSCWLGRRWLRQNTTESTSREHQLCSAWAGFIICADLWLLVYWLEPAHFDLAKSLPLQMCDIAGILAPLVFLTHWRPIRGVLYFWGIGLSTQAFIQPTLEQGIGLPYFWVFWLNHLTIVGSAIYDLVVRRYRPTFRDYIVTTLFTIAWYAVAGFTNLALSSNYGYNGRTHTTPDTIIDALGPWPARVFILAGIVIVWFAALWAIWPLSAKLLRKNHP